MSTVAQDVLPQLPHVLDELEGLLHIPLRRDESLSKHTSFRIGGPAAAYATITSLVELKEALNLIMTARVPYAVLGRGTNLLVSDEGYPGVILILGSNFRDIKVNKEKARIIAGGGVLLARVLAATQGEALTGLEFATGIPGTVAAGLVGNAGTGEESLGAFVRKVTLLVPGKGLCCLSQDDLCWEYRDSSLRNAGIVLEAELQLMHGDGIKITNKMKGLLSRRQASQPQGVANAGSIFKNPSAEVVAAAGLTAAQGSAGALIERLGFKGKCCGDAQVSETHANFIINAGTAAARDVLSLMTAIQEGVKRKYGIWLEPEIRLLGSFETS